MEINKIITHAGVFHADELLAIATLFVVNTIDLEKIDIERKNQVSVEELADPSILIIDVGAHYQPELGNFDHHQDANLPASNLLILEHFCKDIDIKNILKKQLYNYVSNVDKGLIIIKDGGDSATFNSIIRNLNNINDDEGFNVAIILACATLEGYLRTAELSIQTKSYWYALERRYDGKIIIEKEGRFIPNWTELAINEGVLLMVSENPRGGFQIVSRDSQEIQIPINEHQSFRHNSGFMAVYPYFDLAMEHAKEIVEEYYKSRTPQTKNNGL